MRIRTIGAATTSAGTDGQTVGIAARKRNVDLDVAEASHDGDALVSAFRTSLSDAGHSAGSRNRVVVSSRWIGSGSCASAGGTTRTFYRPKGEFSAA